MDRTRRGVRGRGAGRAHGCTVHSRAIAFPIACLMLMLAFAPFVMNRLSFALKEVAVQIAAHASEALGVTLQRSGMTLWLAGVAPCSC
jgi:hypothetical protein